LAGWSLGDGGDREIGPDALETADAELQKQVMRAWFFENYEDPVVSCPHDSGEGGYQYIWGGPYDAEEELRSEFEGVVPEDVILELASELVDESFEWSARPSYEDVDPYLVDAVRANVYPLHTLGDALATITELVDQRIPEHLRLRFDQMLYAGIITALETFLSDCFTQAIAADAARKRRFVETTPLFVDTKLPVAKIYERMEGLDDEIDEYLAGLLWHNLERVKPMYEKTFEIEFPYDLGFMTSAVRSRHDIVHRNGRTPDGQPVVLVAADVLELAEQVRHGAERLLARMEAEEPF
jgi:hypothetical protein